MGNKESRWNDYNVEYAKDHEKKNPHDYWEFKAIFDLYEPKSTDKILEIGCNTGEFCNLLKERYNNKIYGIDINNNAIKMAIDKYPNLNFQNKDIFELKERYDIIYMQHVIEHLKEPEKALIKLRKDNLNCGGKLIITCPNKWAYFLKVYAWRKKTKFCYDPTHVTEFSPLTLSKLIKNAGYKKLKMFTKPLGFPFSYLISPDLYYSLPSWVFGGHIFLLCQI